MLQFYCVITFVIWHFCIFQSNMRSFIVFLSSLMPARLRGTNIGNLLTWRLNTVEWECRINHGMPHLSTKNTGSVCISTVPFCSMFSPCQTQYAKQHVVTFHRCVRSTCDFCMLVNETFWLLIHLLQVCDTYPADLFVPKSATLPVIIGSSKFRSRGRFPSLSYYCKGTQVSFQNSLWVFAVSHSFLGVSF